MIVRHLTNLSVPFQRVNICALLPACLTHRHFHLSRVLKNGETSTPVNYFKIFSLNEEFDIDVPELTRKFRSLQNEWHPDKFASKPQGEQDLAASKSALINRAYWMLKEPLKRSLHLLELAGLPLEEGTISMDPEFLSKIMEINEELADITSPEKMEAVKAKNEAMLKHLTNSLASAFKAKDFQEARKIAAQMKYYANISAKVQHFERERGI